MVCRPACFLFVDAVKAAGSIVYIFWCLLLLLGGMSTVLLHGQYATGDDYIDSQYRDFFHSLSTMSVFLVDNGNYVEAVQPALNVSGLYVAFFMAISVFSMFFVSAILLTLFMNQYSAGAGGMLTTAQHRKWSALTLTHLLCTYSARKPELGQVLLPDSKAESMLDERQDMSPLMFERLMLQCNMFSDMADSWINSVQTLLQESIQMLQKHKGNATREQYRHEAAALATMCCKLQMEAEYNSILNDWFPARAEPHNESKQRGAVSCFDVNQELVLATALVRTGICSDDLTEQIEFVQNILGEMSKKEAELHLLNTSVPLLSADNSDSAEHLKSILCASLQVGVSQRQQPTVHIPNQTWFTGKGNRSFQSLLSQCEMLQLVHQMYQIDQSSTDEITQNVSALITLMHMHIWSCRLIFSSLDVNEDRGLQLVEFEKVWVFSTVSARLATSQLLQAEAEVMLLRIEIDQLEQTLQGAYPTHAPIV